jgi:hypothetical protein
MNRGSLKELKTDKEAYVGEYDQEQDSIIIKKKIV